MEVHSNVRYCLGTVNIPYFFNFSGRPSAAGVQPKILKNSGKNRCCEWPADCSLESCIMQSCQYTVVGRRFTV
jgi:hypothetical protein